MLQFVESHQLSGLACTGTRPGPTVAQPELPSGLKLVIEHTVMCVFAVPSNQLHLARRGRANVALARQTAMYLAHVACSLSLTEVGTLFDRDRTTVAHACAVIEDRRDDTDFDRAIELLERAVMALKHPKFAIPN